jgi:nicotinate-nucleotide adenylyltransferase
MRRVDVVTGVMGVFYFVSAGYDRGNIAAYTQPFKMGQIMRLGLFGGTFDPVHMGHLMLAESCREQCRLEEVWFLPAFIPPHKQGQRTTPAETRIEMLQLVVGTNPAFSVCSYEVDRGGVSYTADTLAHFREQDPDGELFFMLGADMLNDLPHWYQPRRVCELATPIVVDRAGAEPPNFAALESIASAEKIEQIRDNRVEMPEIGISSSEIRNNIAKSRSIRYQVPRAVEKFIATHGLYAGE